MRKGIVRGQFLHEKAASARKRTAGCINSGKSVGQKNTRKSSSLYTVRWDKGGLAMWEGAKKGSDLSGEEERGY